MSSPNDNSLRTHDPEMDALATRLDALGAVERAGAPAGLEESVLSKVADVFAPGAIRFEPRQRRWWQSGAVRLAAAVALFASVAGVLYTQSRPAQRTPAGGEVVTVAMVESRIDGLLSLVGDGSDSFGDQVASVDLWADALDSDVDEGWVGSDLGEFGYGEGSL